MDWGQKEGTWSLSAATQQVWDFQKVIYSPWAIISPSVKRVVIKVESHLSFNSYL